MSLEDLLYNSIPAQKINKSKMTEWVLQQLPGYFKFADNKFLHNLYNWGETYNIDLQENNSPENIEKYNQNCIELAKSLALLPFSNGKSREELKSELQRIYEGAMHYQCLRRTEGNFVEAMPEKVAIKIADMAYCSMHGDES